MKTLHFSKTINAPVEKVWNTMLEDETYRQWASAFGEGSHYEGNWEEGSKMRFLGADGSGGMVSSIAENRPHEFISVKHIGIVKDGVEDTESGEAKEWAPAYENYSFTESGGKTTLSVDMDVNKEYEDMFKEMWPNALENLKELCEE